MGIMAGERALDLARPHGGRPLDCAPSRRIIHCAPAARSATPEREEKGETTRRPHLSAYQIPKDALYSGGPLQRSSRK